jgi:hypothetical protein
MTEEQRQQWNAAVAACREDPDSAEKAAHRDKLRNQVLMSISYKIMEEDDYQGRTHQA